MLAHCHSRETWSIQTGTPSVCQEPAFHNVLGTGPCSEAICAQGQRIPLLSWGDVRKLSEVVRILGRNHFWTCDPLWCALIFKKREASYQCESWATSCASRNRQEHLGPPLKWEHFRSDDPKKSPLADEGPVP